MTLRDFEIAQDADIIVITAGVGLKRGRLCNGAIHCGIASAIARICQAIVHNTDLILTVGIVPAEVEGVP